MKYVAVNRKAEEEIKNGRLNVFKQNVERTNAKDGDWVEVRYNNDVLGYGFYSANSSIPVKLYTREEYTPEEFIEYRLKELYVIKQSLYGDVFRWVNAEGDLFPGLIIDLYGESAFVKVSVKGLHDYRNIIFDVLVDNGVENIVYEGVKEVNVKRTLIRGRKNTVIVKEGDSLFIVDLLKGQKTGFYLDQRDNRIEAYRNIEGVRVLDVFAYTGSYGIHFAVKGADVTFVELGSWEANMIKRNMELNEVSGKVIKGNAFDVIKRMKEKGKQFDVVIIDPPAFIKGRDHKEKGKRGYHLINYLTSHLLKDGGVLITSSCSHYLTLSEFIGIVNGSLSKAGKKFLIMGHPRGQSKDHTIYMPQPESYYLKTLFGWVE